MFVEGEKRASFTAKTPSCSKRPRRPRDRETQLAPHDETTERGGGGGCLYKLIKQSELSSEGKQRSLCNHGVGAGTYLRVRPTAARW